MGTDDPVRNDATGGKTQVSETISDRPEDVPVWQENYLDAVGVRLMHYYSLEKDVRIDGQHFELFGEMNVLHERHAFHPALSFAHHKADEYVFATRIDHPDVQDFKRFISLGEQLATEWIDRDENHYSTDFSFAVACSEISDSVRSFVSSYKNRNLLKFGYFGHYEINLIVIDSARKESVASRNADVEQAFRVWEPIIPEEPTRLDRFLNWITR